MTQSKSYYRIMLGKGSRHASQCHQGSFIPLTKDLRLQRALRVTQNINFCRYQVNFELLHD